MRNGLDAIDPMVVSLKVAADPVLDNMKLLKFEICMSEALTNIVKHAKFADDNEQVDVMLCETSTALTAEIFDPRGAAPFDLRDHANVLSDVDAMAEGGRGLGLILECADEVTYEPAKDRSRLVLKFLKQKT